MVHFLFKNLSEITPLRQSLASWITRSCIDHSYEIVTKVASPFFHENFNFDSTIQSLTQIFYESQTIYIDVSGKKFIPQKIHNLHVSVHCLNISVTFLKVIKESHLLKRLCQRQI